MRKINLSEIPDHERKSPTGKYYARYKEISLALGHASIRSMVGPSAVRFLAVCAARNDSRIRCRNSVLVFPIRSRVTCS